MSAGERVPLAVARTHAQELLTLLSPGCERIEIAGSIRRETETVGDIELVAIPRVTAEVAPDGLFGDEITTETDHLARVVASLTGSGIVTPDAERPADGPRYSKLTHWSGMQVDLFTVRPPATWGVLFLLRTGPPTFSHWLVTEAKRRGHHIASGQLHLGGLGCPIGTTPCQVIDTPEEGAVFDALEIAYRPPHLRHVTFR